MDKLIVFTDLDGTLLDPVTYGFDAALPALREIESREIPLILCSSKTRGEIEVFRRQLHNPHPFIAENGGGIFIPHGYFADPIAGEDRDAYRVISTGMSYTEIRRHFVELRDRLDAKVRGFGDMTLSEVASLTGLKPAAAKLAMQREFDEPFVFDGVPDPRFLQAIEQLGLHWTQGRIFHLMGRHHKGEAVGLLKRLYQKQRGVVIAVGLGDSLNDLPMLMAVDRPVLVRHADGHCDERIDLPALVRTATPGPAGWGEALLQLLAAPRPPATSPIADHPDDLRTILYTALSAVDPYQAVLNAVQLDGNQLHVAGSNYPLAAYSRILVIGAGKSGARMAQALEHLLGDRISDGMVITKYGHALPTQIIRMSEAAHPVPDVAGIKATQKILRLLQGVDAHTLVICLLSGGASALMIAPAHGITLTDKQLATNLLLRAGASIGELNAVRKHLSAVKGGRLAQTIYPAKLLTLILSDVIGNPLDVIASGPTAADASTFADALAVIDRYGLARQMPAPVMQRLQLGKDGGLPETAKQGDSTLSSTQNVIVGSLDLALSAAEIQARALNYETETVERALQGEARDAAGMMAQRARDELAGMHPNKQRCLIWGGETTVTVHGNGKGGRNQEMALAFALAIAGLDGVSLLSAGTDGTDGPTDAAGAMVDGQTIPLARRLGITPEPYLEQNDSYSFFHRLDALAGTSCHIITGPTGTNVMDLQVMLVDKPSAAQVAA